MKIALMDRFGEWFTEDEDFMFYARGFLDRGNEVVQMDPYTIDFKTGKGMTKIVLPADRPLEIEREETAVEHPLEDFDAILDVSDIVDREFSRNMTRIDTLHFNPQLATHDSANKGTYVHRYPDFIPDTIMSNDPEVIEAALHGRFNGKMVVKDPFGSCGKSMALLAADDPEYHQTLEEMTQGSKRTLMAQKFIHFAQEGGKRVIVLGNIGDPSSYRVTFAYHKKPKEGEWQDNLAKGATATIVDLRPDEDRLCREVAARSDLYGVGLDIMDDQNAEGERIPVLVETNSVVATGGLYPEAIKDVTNFILDELLADNRR